MIHEHEATEFASAAIDFTLAPDVQRELARELADCPVCAERADAYREQLRLMQRLPVLDASERARNRVAAAAMSGHVQARSPMMLLLAAALVLAMLLGVAAAAGALLTQKRDDLSVVEPTPPPLASSVVDASAPTPSNGPEFGAGGQVFADKLELDSIVEIVSDNLRVRSAPRVADDSALLAPLLRRGDRLFVTEGPVVASGYDWYRIILVGTDPELAWNELRSGWVSRGDHDATPWIAPAPSSCPEAPLEIAVLNAMHPLERLACFTDEELSFLAVIEGGSQSGWIADSRADGYLEAAIPDLEVVIEPAPNVGPSDLPDSRSAVLEGSFDGDQCVPLIDFSALLGCRAHFLVTRATVDAPDLAGGLAITVTDGLRVRDRPLVEDSGKRELLANGTRLAVVSGPAVGSGYVWYRVVVPSIRASDGRPRIGWVAAHGKDGEQWVGPEEFDCPAPADLTVERVAFLTSRPVFHGGVACYGRGGVHGHADFAITAHARLDCSGPSGTGSTWLDDFGQRLVLTDGGFEASAVMSSYPAALRCDEPDGFLLYRASGHFDDDDASECGATGQAAGRHDPRAVYECRTRFVVTDLTAALGSDPRPVPSAP